MTSRLTYDERWHRYALDGRRVPNVTTTIGKASEKPGLAYAAAREAALWALHHFGEVDAMQPTGGGGANPSPRRARGACCQRRIRKRREFFADHRNSQRVCAGK